MRGELLAPIGARLSNLTLGELGLSFVSVAIAPAVFASIGLRPGPWSLGRSGSNENPALLRGSQLQLVFLSMLRRSDQVHMADAKSFGQFVKCYDSGVAVAGFKSADVLLTKA